MEHLELANAAFNSLRNFLTYKVKSNPTEPQLKALVALMDDVSRLAFEAQAGDTRGRCRWVAGRRNPPATGLQPC